MKKLFYLLILTLSFSIISCEKSDNEAPSYSSMVLGTWQLDKMWEDGYGITEWDQDDIEVPYIIFESNGTGKLKEYDSYNDRTYEDKFTWSITDNQLKVTYDEDDGGHTSVGSINTLNNKELILEWKSNGEHWREYWIKVK